MTQRIDDVRADPKFCILCGEPNHCALAEEALGAQEGAGSPPPCWCVSEEFPTRLVERVAQGKGQAQCICRQCLDRHREIESK